jgi:hypothetical protein
MSERNSSEESSFFSSVAMIALLPFFPAIVLYLAIRSYTENYLSERRIRLRMQGCGRFLRKSDARVRIEEYPGTLIIENPTISWDYTRAWWDLWCYHNYTCPDHGCAFLLRVWNGAAFGSAISREFPKMAIVHNWTGFVKMRL